MWLLWLMAVASNVFSWGRFSCQLNCLFAIICFELDYAFNVSCHFETAWHVCQLVGLAMFLADSLIVYDLLMPGICIHEHGTRPFGCVSVMCRVVRVIEAHLILHLVTNCAQFIMISHIDVSLSALLDMCCQTWSWHHDLFLLGFITPLESSTALSSDTTQVPHRCYVMWMLVQLTCHHVLSLLGSLVSWYTHSSSTALSSKHLQVAHRCYAIHICWWMLLHLTWHHVLSLLGSLVPWYTHSSPAALSSTC